jgi:beta-carotene ketolase (CrtO type)
VALMDVDVAVVGAGHNGLVCAGYLARQGLRVAAFEQREDIGGCTRTIDFPRAPGFRVNTCADVDIFFHGGPVPRELELQKYGFEPLERELAFCAPLEDGRRLLIWHDEERTLKEIRRISQRDADSYSAYLEYWREAFRRLGPIEEDAPPAPDELIAALGGDGWATEFYELLISPPQAFARTWFQSDVMRGFMAWHAALYQVPPDEPGSGLGLGHLAGCVLTGITRPRGGMSGLCGSLERCLTESGGVVRRGSPVSEIVIDGERVAGLTLADGERVSATAVVSSIDARRVFGGLADERVLAAPERAAVARITVNDVGLMRVSLALRGLPAFRHADGDAATPDHEVAKASFMLDADSWEKVQSQWNRVRDGDLPPIANNMWIGIPTAMDPGLAPAGGHVVSFAEYVPYRLRDGSWESRREEAAERVIDSWSRIAPDTRRQLEAVWIQTPEDLERETGNINGNPFHIDQTFHQMFGMRPTPQLSRYRTPVDGLYLSGSGTHPGGGVTGLPGRNAARTVLADLGEGRRSVALSGSGLGPEGIES